jgi:hypothetical protein
LVLDNLHRIAFRRGLGLPLYPQIGHDLAPESALAFATRRLSEAPVGVFGQVHTFMDKLLYLD